MSSTMEIGKKLVELCKAGKNEAMDMFYSENIVSIEAGAPPGRSARSEGIAAIKGKSEWWRNNHEVHKGDAMGPWPHGDRFIVRFSYDITPKTGPMTGKRFTMEEAALYTSRMERSCRKNFSIRWADENRTSAAGSRGV